MELSILDSLRPDTLIAHAKCGPDIATARLRMDAAWSNLQSFRQRLNDGIRGKRQRPASDEVDRFGHELFDFVMRNDVGRLYRCLQQDRTRQEVSLTIFSDRAEIQDLPWEYLQEPDSTGGPGDRAVVRLLPTIGLTPPQPLRARSGVKVLFVAADPITQSSVSWPDVEATLYRAFEAKVPKALNLTIVEGASQAAISRAIRTGNTFDIFHFSGHGEVRRGVGGLLMADGTSFLTAGTLASLLRGAGIRLAILSACETSAGSRTERFSVVADSLIRAGIPAVVANQVAVPNSTVATFVGALYSELLSSGDIDRAVTRGRKALAFELASTVDGVGIEWGIPTLHRLLGGSQVYAL